MNIYRLEGSIEEAIGKGKKYIGILIEQHRKVCLEIYTQDRYREVMKYFKDAYDKDLKSTLMCGVSITGYASGDNLAQIEDSLFGSNWFGKTNIQAMSTEQLVQELKQREGVNTFTTTSLEDRYTIKTENVNVFEEDKITTIRENSGPCIILEVID